MGSKEFGELAEGERRRRGWTRSKLAVAVGILDDGTALDATQIRRIVEGTRKLTPDIVRRIIQALDLPEDEAWHASGLWPPDLDLEGYRRFRTLAAVGATDEQRAVMAPRLPAAGQGVVVPFDRRRRDRRRPRLEEPAA